jgi:pyruvate kinase
MPNDVKRGVTLLLDDGRIEFWVEEVKGTEIICKVVQGGVLSNNKGINRKGGGLSAAALTEKDIEDIKTAAALNADYLAVSFPRSGADMRQARELLRAAGGKSQLVAKIERTEAIENLEEILEASDAIMVARGDLGVEVGDAAVPALQKRMIRMALERNKVVITATQMMESMISSPIPTRAEVSDVANAVLDGTDAVMLSAKRLGQFPSKRSRRCTRPSGAGGEPRFGSGLTTASCARRGDCDVGGVYLGAPQHQGDCRTDRIRQHLPVDEPALHPGASLCLDTRGANP